MLSVHSSRLTLAVQPSLFVLLALGKHLCSVVMPRQVRPLPDLKGAWNRFGVFGYPRAAERADALLGLFDADRDGCLGFDEFRGELWG